MRFQPPDRPVHDNKGVQDRDHFALSTAATEAFHGGRNDAFWYGPTDDSDGEAALPFREYGLISAYASALAAIATPDYDNARATTDSDECDPGVPGLLVSASASLRSPAFHRCPSGRRPAGADLPA